MRWGGQQHSPELVHSAAATLQTERVRCHPCGLVMAWEGGTKRSKSRFGRVAERDTILGRNYLVQSGFKIIQTYSNSFDQSPPLKESKSESYLSICMLDQSYKTRNNAVYKNRASQESHHFIHNPGKLASLPRKPQSRKKNPTRRTNLPHEFHATLIHKQCSRRDFQTRTKTDLSQARVNSPERWAEWDNAVQQKTNSQENIRTCKCAWINVWQPQAASQSPNKRNKSSNWDLRGLTHREPRSRVDLVGVEGLPPGRVSLRFCSKSVTVSRPPEKNTKVCETQLT
jgi:hypothetical protein